MKIYLFALYIFILTNGFQNVCGQINTYRNWYQNNNDDSQLQYYNQYDDSNKWLPPRDDDLSTSNSNWNGKYFPHSPNEPDTNHLVEFESVFHDKHGIPMGISNSDCDDGKTNLTVDWNLNPENFTCFENKDFYAPRSDVHPLHSSEYIPKYYTAYHECMNTSIHYNELIPTFGTHRPLWAVYGEYKFLPPQRWVHNLEHGAVVMLYHPCADGNQVDILRKIVRNCLYRHVITPYNLLTMDRPLALVTWGHRLEMSKISPEVVTNFIKQHALKGPEALSRNGQYSFLLERPAEFLNGEDDSIVCRDFMNNFHMK